MPAATRQRALAAALSLAISVFGLPVGAPAQPVDPPTPAQGNVLGILGRQVCWLNLEAPRPRPLTSLQAPAYALDLAALPGASSAVVAVSRPFAEQGDTGGDLYAMDLGNGSLSPLVMRLDARESLGMPALWADGSGLIFQRDDTSAPPTAVYGQASVHYPNRVETAAPDGTGRTVLIADGRSPSPSPDGSMVAFVRGGPAGSGLWTWSRLDGQERLLIPDSRFTDVAYPRFSPRGDRIAFVAPEPFYMQQPGRFLAGLLMPSVALAHGLPWDVWTVDADGSNLIRLAELGADDPSVSWSPDGTQLFVYSLSGSSIVDVATGAILPLYYVAGYGSTAWLP